MTTLLGIPLHVQSSMIPGLGNLTVHLVEAGYPYDEIDRVLDYVAHEGTLGGLADRGWIAPSEEAAAEQAFVSGLGAVPADSERWDDPGVWTDLDSWEDALERAQGDQGPEPPEDLPPIAGGCDDPTWPRGWNAEERAAFERSIIAHFRINR